MVTYSPTYFQESTILQGLISKLTAHKLNWRKQCFSVWY